MGNDQRRETKKKKKRVRPTCIFGDLELGLRPGTWSCKCRGDRERLCWSENQRLLMWPPQEHQDLRPWLSLQSHNHHSRNRSSSSRRRRKKSCYESLWKKNRNYKSLVVVVVVVVVGVELERKKERNFQKLWRERKNDKNESDPNRYRGMGGMDWDLESWENVKVFLTIFSRISSRQFHIFSKMGVLEMFILSFL